MNSVAITENKRKYVQLTLYQIQHAYSAMHFPPFLFYEQSCWHSNPDIVPYPLATRKLCYLAEYHPLQKSTKQQISV